MQDLRLFRFRGRRVAAATMGAGPVLVLPPWWITHLEADLADEHRGRFLRALARAHTVVRYDRPGTGASERADPPATWGLSDEVALLEGVLDELEIESARFLGVSCGGCVAAAFAAAHADRVQGLAVYGGFLDGRRLGDASVRRAVAEIVRNHWGLGSRLLTDMFIPHATDEERRSFDRLQRDAATAQTAAALLEEIYGFDLTGSVGAVAPGTLVLHRSRDRVVPLDAGRDLAAGLAQSRLLTLQGEHHPPWDGDSGEVLGALGSFLAGEAPLPVPPARTSLTSREREVLALVAAGLGDREIADRLVLSPHTVHRHVANIRSKLGLSSRAAVAAYAVRQGLAT